MSHTDVVGRLEGFLNLCSNSTDSESTVDCENALRRISTTYQPANAPTCSAAHAVRHQAESTTNPDQHFNGRSHHGPVR
ncbi:MAG: hypothetical protein RBT16_13965 [Desulfococcus multivorans]|jgi:hypothetical protein|nr:hypothetical protein [Desulfococcus multivorans]